MNEFTILYIDFIVGWISLLSENSMSDNSRGKEVGTASFYKNRRHNYTRLAIKHDTKAL
jgi:hypothetical protein